MAARTAGEPDVANPVPLVMVDSSGRDLSLRDDLPEAGLANLAATLLQLLDLDVPER